MVFKENWAQKNYKRWKLLYNNKRRKIDKRTAVAAFPIPTFSPRSQTRHRRYGKLIDEKFTLCIIEQLRRPFTRGNREKWRVCCVFLVIAMSRDHSNARRKLFTIATANPRSQECRASVTMCTTHERLRKLLWLCEALRVFPSPSVDMWNTSDKNTFQFQFSFYYFRARDSHSHFEILPM